MLQALAKTSNPRAPPSAEAPTLRTICTHVESKAPNSRSGSDRGIYKSDDGLSKKIRNVGGDGAFHVSHITIRRRKAYEGMGPKAKATISKIISRKHHDEKTRWKERIV